MVVLGIGYGNLCRFLVYKSNVGSPQNIPYSPALLTGSSCEKTSKENRSRQARQARRAGWLVRAGTAGVLVGTAGGQAQTKADPGNLTRQAVTSFYQAR